MNEAHTRPQTLREGLESLDYVSAPENIKAGALLGPYRLIKLLGEGGMGSVWLADQLEPFERKVAIKFAHAATSGQNQAYLEVERQALARMVHPYIAQIYDAGATASGAMFFVMEFVEGVELEQQLACPATAKRADVRLREAAKLMRKICEGAHYAHQRGLIHRDLKPSNVLVVQLAGEAIPKIIDFGIAVGMDPHRGSAQAGTAGTLAYMAPEQLNPTPEGIDVRADVHALGVILVELLSHAGGRRVHLEQAISVREILATRQKSGSDETRTTAQSPLRRERAAAAIALIPRELRAIARKATAEDRNLRYDSAAAMADDLQRWLDRRPVQALSQGRWYAFRCFVNRYRIASSLGALTLAALVIGLVVASYGLSEARAARALADARREQAEGLIGYMLGDFSAKLESIGKFELFDGVATRALEYLRQANDQDAVSATHRAAALRTIGDIQMRRGQLDAAEATFLLANAAMDQAEGFGPPTAEVFYERAQVAFWLGNRAFVERDFAASSAHWKDYLGFAEQLERLKPGDSTAVNEVVSAKINLGVVAFESSNLESAQSAFEEAAKVLGVLIEREPENFTALQTLAEVISWKARVEEARGLLAEARDSYFSQLAVLKNLVNSNVDSTKSQIKFANTEHLAALVLLQLGENEEAISSFRRVANEFESLFKVETQNFDMQRRLALCQSNLAWALKSVGNNAEAKLVMRKALANLGTKNDEQEDNFNWQKMKGIAFQRAGQIFPEDHSKNYSIEGQRILENLVGRDDVNLSVHVALANGFLFRRDLDFNREEYIAKFTSAISRRNSADLVDILFRLHVSAGDRENALVLQSKLHKMGYRHPDYMAFLADNSIGASQ